MQLMDEEIIAMAVACIAEEIHADISRIKVISFHEVPKSSLDKFIEMNELNYRKYQLGDELL